MFCIVLAYDSMTVCVIFNLQQTHFFGIFREQGTCLIAANVVLFLLNEI